MTEQSDCQECFSTFDESELTDVIRQRGTVPMCERCIANWLEDACYSEIEANKAIFSQDEYIRLVGC